MIISQDKRKYLWRIFVILVLVVILQSFLQNAEALKNIYSTIIGYLKPFIYAIFIAIILTPLSNYLQHKFSMKRWVSISLAVTFIVLIFALLILSMVPGLSDSIEEIRARTPEYTVAIKGLIEKVLDFMKAKGFVAVEPNVIQNNIDSFLTGNSMNIFKTLSFSIMGIVVTLGQISLGFLLAVFFVNDREYFQKLIYNTVYVASNRDKADKAMDFLDKSRQIFLNYLLGKFISSVGVAVVALVIMLVAGVPYALLIAILLGIGNMIPYIGALVAMAVGLILVFISAPNKIIYLLIANLFSQQLESIYISPKIIGKTVGLSSFWVITGVLLGGAVMGPIGMILGVPVVGVIKLIYQMNLERKLSSDSSNEKGEIND